MSMLEFMSPFYLSHTSHGLGLKMKLETESDHFCALFLCTGLTSAAELRRTVLSGKLPCCLLDAGMVRKLFLKIMLLYLFFF